MALRGLFYFLTYFFKLLTTPCQRHVIYRWNEVSPLHCVSLVCFATLRTASAKTYITAPKLIRGLFLFTMCNIVRILIKCCPILQMLQTLTYVIFCGTRKGSYTTNHWRYIFSKRIYNYYGMLPFRLISILNSNGSSLLLYIILYIK